MANTITPTVFYRTLKVEGLEIFYREAGPRADSRFRNSVQRGTSLDWKSKKPLVASASRKSGRV
jgi:hypothetical protein